MYACRLILSHVLLVAFNIYISASDFHGFGRREAVFLYTDYKASQRLHKHYSAGSIAFYASNMAKAEPVKDWQRKTLPTIAIMTQPACTIRPEYACWKYDFAGGQLVNATYTFFMNLLDWTYVVKQTCQKWLFRRQFAFARCSSTI